MKVKLSSGRSPFHADGTLKSSPGQAYLVNTLLKLVPHPKDEKLGYWYVPNLLQRIDLVPNNILLAVADHIKDEAEDGKMKYRPRLDEVERLVATAAAMHLAVKQNRAAFGRQDAAPPPAPEPPRPRPVLLLKRGQRKSH